MNLLAEIKREVKEKNLTNKKDIKDYIYKRTGELFNYDPLLLFADTIERQLLIGKKVDIKNVTCFDILCIQWAHLYVDLLKEFGIVARVRQKGEHRFVEVFMDGKTYIDDLIIGYTDITRIKFGMNPICNNIENYQLKTKYCEINDTSISTSTTESSNSNKINIEDSLKLTKTNLELVRINMNLSNSKFNHLAFKTIETIIKNYEKINNGFVATCAFVKNLITDFVGQDLDEYACYFYNKDEKSYIKVYSIPVEDKIYYFSIYSFNNENSRVSEISETDVKTLLENYNIKDAENLIINKTCSNTYMASYTKKKGYYKI